MIGTLNLVSNETSIIDSVHLSLTFAKQTDAGNAQVGSIAGELASPLIVDDVMISSLSAPSSIRQTGDVVCLIAPDADDDNQVLTNPGLIIGEVYYSQPQSDFEFPSADAATNCLGSGQFTPIVSTETSFDVPPAEAFAAGARAIETCDAWDEYDPNVDRAEFTCTFTPGSDARGLSDFGQGMRITDDPNEVKVHDSDYDWLMYDTNLPHPIWDLKLGRGAPNPLLDGFSYQVFLEAGTADSGPVNELRLVSGNFELPESSDIGFSKGTSILRKWKDLSDNSFSDPGIVVTVSSDMRFEAIWADLCQQGTYSADGYADENGDCTDASTGNYVPMPGSLLQTECPLGTYQDQSGQMVCIFADPGFYVDTVGSATQQRCSEGQFSESAMSTTCISASPGYAAEVEGFDALTDVYSEFFLDEQDQDNGEPGARDQTECLPGTYSPGGVEQCLDAPTGTFTFTSGASAPVLCPAGFYQDETGQTVCKSADEGFYVSLTGSAEQLECPTGTYTTQTAQRDCALAPAGKYLTKAEFTAGSQQEVDFVGQGIGADLARDCPAGNYAAFGDGVCTEAPVGHFVPSAGASAPVACEPGTYQDSEGQVDCLNAEPGSFVAGSGAVESSPCEPGTFTSAAGASFCKDAEPGYVVTTSGLSVQTECEAGTYSTGGAESCTEADLGHYVATAGSSGQTPCEPGTYQNLAGQIGCIEAEPGHEVPESGATAPTECDPGTFAATAGTIECREATPGHFVAASGATAQTQCEPGYYSDAFGAEDCTIAPAGTYVITGSQFAALDCPMGTDSNEGASQCTPDEEFVPETPPASGGSGGGGGGGAVGAAPIADVRPVVAGTNSVGNTLATTEGEWQGDSLEFSYQWYRCDEELEAPTQLQVLIDCDPIPGATNETYEVSSADASKHLLASISASAGFYSTTIFSDTIAPGETVEGEVSAGAEEPASDAATATGYWTKRNGDNVKLYAKNIIGLGKVQFFMNGEEIAWIRAQDKTDPKLRVITEGHMKGASYLVRDRDLRAGKNVFEIYIDGERIVRRIASLN